MTASATTITTFQILLLVIFGAALWFALLPVLGSIGRLEPADGWVVELVYALIVPAAFMAIRTGRQLAQLTRAQIVPGVVVMSATAAALHAVGLTWFRRLYGVDPAGAGAVILWGVAVALVLALIIGRPERA